MGRPRIHADPAARQKAWRDNKRSAVLTIAQASKLDELAEQYETTRAVVVHNLVHFALMNRNWKQTGLMHFHVPVSPQITTCEVDQLALELDDGKMPVLGA